MTEMSQAPLSSRGLFVVVLAAFLLSGCGEPPPATTGILNGTVKSGGEVCGDCRVSIFNPKTLLSRGGSVNESGKFEIKDIPFGDYEIIVGQQPTSDRAEVFDKRIPAKYRDPKTSGFKASFTGPEPVTLDIEME